MQSMKIHKVHVLEVHYSECEWENGDHIAIKGET